MPVSAVNAALISSIPLASPGSEWLLPTDTLPTAALAAGWDAAGWLAAADPAALGAVDAPDGPQAAMMAGMVARPATPATPFRTVLRETGRVSMGSAMDASSSRPVRQNPTGSLGLCASRIAVSRILGHTRVKSSQPRGSRCAIPLTFVGTSVTVSIAERKEGQRG